VPSEAPPHPLDAHQLEPTEAEVASTKAGSGNLHRLPEFRAWLPSKDAVDALLAQVGQGITPGNEPSQEQLSGLVEAAVVAMTDRFFTPQLRERIVATMKDSALSVLAREGRSIALDVVATMRAIGSCGLITDAPHEVGFLRGFFDKAIAVLLAQGQGSLRIPVRQAAPAPTAETAAADGEDAAPPTEISYSTST